MDDLKTTDLLCEHVVIALSRRATDQGIVHALVQAANSVAAVSPLVDFEMGSQKKLRWKLFDREADGIRRVRKNVCTKLVVAWISDCGRGTALPRRYNQIRPWLVRPWMRLSFDYLQI